MTRVDVLMATGFEEMELTITVDVLRRGGLRVDTVTLADTLAPVVGSRGIAMVPDRRFADLDFAGCDLLVLPGGREGTERLAADPRVLALVRERVGAGRPVAAICAAPMVLKAAGVLTPTTLVTSHPAVATELAGSRYLPARVVSDGPLVTSRAAGTTFDFAFALLARLCGPAAVREVNRGVLAIVPDTLPERLA